MKLNAKEIGITEIDYDDAERYAKEVRNIAKERGIENYKKTSNRFNQTRVGYLGECCFEKFLGQLDKDFEWYIDFEPDRGIDFLLEDTFIDVKTTRRGVSPYWIVNSGENVECSVFSNQLKKAKCKRIDLFAFVSLLESDDVGYLLGWLPVDEFVEKSVFLEKGSELGSGKKVIHDSYMVHWKDLNDVRELKDL